MPINEETDVGSGWGKRPFLWMAQILLGSQAQVLGPVRKGVSASQLAVGLSASEHFSSLPGLASRNQHFCPRLPVFRMWYWLWPSLFPVPHESHLFP